MMLQMCEMNQHLYIGYINIFFFQNMCSYSRCLTRCSSEMQLRIRIDEKFFYKFILDILYSMADMCSICVLHTYIKKVQRFFKYINFIAVLIHAYVIMKYKNGSRKKSYQKMYLMCKITKIMKLNKFNSYNVVQLEIQSNKI